MTSKVGTILGSTTSLAPIYLVYHLIKSEISATVAKPVVATPPEVKEEETDSEQKTEVEEKQEEKEPEKQEEANEKVSSNETITKVTLEVVSKALSVISVIGSK